MDCRVYGDAPYRAVVVHGGPGAPGTCAGICRGLAGDMGVLEHLQTKHTIEALLAELHGILDRYGLQQTVLIGHSWGAWLSYLFAARYPDAVQKLILVGSGPFEAAYVPQIAQARAARLTLAQAQAMQEAFSYLNSGSAGHDDARQQAFFDLPDTDHYCLLDDIPEDMLHFDEAQYRALFGEIVPMRESGALLAYAEQIRCPVLAIHGRDDPHPVEGVRGPLAGRLRDFRLVELEKCGHDPWKERYAREAFFDILRNEIP